MILQHAPAAFNRVVLAVIGGQVDQFYLQSRPVRKFHQTLHELRARTVDLRSVVQLDLQTFHARVMRSAFVPPLLKSIGDEVARLARCSKGQPQLIKILISPRDFQNPERNEYRRRAHVVIDGLRRLPSTGPASAAEGADFGFRLGIQGNSQARRVIAGGFAAGLDVGEDIVGFRNFFSGRVLTTRRSR